MKDTAVARDSGGLSMTYLERDIAKNGDAMLAASLDNFAQVFAVKPDDRVLLLIDRDLDHRVTEHIATFVRGRGAAFQAVTVEVRGNPSGGNSASKDIPREIEPLLTDWATFVVSTWFSSAIHPLNLKLRREKGQRWVKITFFRNWDYLRSAAAAFPLDLISLILRTTASMYPRGEDVDIHITDPRGTDVHVRMTPQEVDRLLSQSRWQGEVTADRPGCYVHYIPTHGPNLVDTEACGVIEHVDGIVIPQCAVGFAEYFTTPPRLVIKDNWTTEVTGGGEYQSVLEHMLVGSRLIELGCGFNPKWPREQTYPAGSNAPGSLHFGMDLDHEDDYVARAMPNWPEPPLHMDLVLHDATVRVNSVTLVQDGVLQSLHDPEVRKLAARYGDAAVVLNC